MRVLKVFGFFLLLVILCGLYYVVSNCYDPIRDEFVLSPEITVDFDSIIHSVEKNKSEYNINYSRQYDAISFSNMFSVRYKCFRLVGYFCVLSEFFSLIIVFLIMSKFCKKSLFDTLKSSDDLVIFFMVSILMGLVFAIFSTFIYNTKFNNNNFVNYRYNEWPEICVNNSSKCFIIERK